MDLEQEKKGLRTWVEIDKKAIEHNYQAFRNIIKPESKLMTVVKSNAYGHGLVDFSKELDGLGTDWFGVDSITEASALRKEGITKPVLVLGFTLPEKIIEASENDISLTVSSFEMIEAIKKANLEKKLKIHIKVDTGMGRQGFLEKDLEKVLDEIKNLNKKIEIEGIFTHFAAAKNPAFPKYTMTQVSVFNNWVSAFNNAGINPIRHTAASSATLIFPDTHFDMVRVGISMYGLWPSPEVEAFCRDKIILQPVLSWKTVIGEIKELKKGSRVGYDCTETLEKDSKIAVCPIGYWHGFSRLLSSVGRVLVKGERCRVIGRVSMDMISIDVTKTEGLEVGDEVVIIGSQSSINVYAEELGSLSDTTGYEIITRINPLIKRIFT